MTRDQLVRALVAELAPVRRLPRPSIRAARWAGLAALSVALGAWLLGLRPDLLHKLSEPAYLAQTAALIAIAGAAATAAFRLAVPGAARAAPVVPVLAGLTWLVVVARRSGLDDDAAALAWRTGLPCVARVVGLASAPAAAVIVLLRRAAPHDRRWIGGLALLAAAALAALGTQAVCARDQAAHVLAWHVIPVAAIALAGLAAGGAAFRRRAAQLPVDR
jgi:hypothetical protein